MTDGALHLLKGAAMSSAGAAGAVVAGAEVGLSLSQIATLVAVVSTSIGTAYAIDTRMDKKLRVHTDEDKERHEAIMDESVAGRQQLRREMKAEFKHLREMLSFAGVIPEHTPAAIRLPAADGTIPPEEDTQP